MNPNHQLTKEGIEQLEKMAHEGAKNSSEALSKLVNQEIKVETLAVRTIPVEEIAEIVGSPEDIVTTIIMGIHGQVDGNIMLIYPQQSAINVADLLARRDLGQTSVLSELDKSALKESGNIISGSFLSAISDYLSINMVESIPDVATDMLKATMDFVLSRFATKDVSEAVAFEIDFEMGTNTGKEIERIRAYFVVLLDVESATKVLGSLKEISGGQAMRE
jgi:chemotaxis protein CheC